MKEAVKKEAAKTKVARAGLPSGVKIIEGKEEVALDAASIRLVMEGWAAKKAVDEAKARLDAINEKLLEAHGTGCALVVTGICRASLAARQSVKISDPARLEQALGGRFLDLVREEVSYRPQQALLDMAADGDHALQPVIAECLTMGESFSVTWRAER